jgi:hypothetical protein
MYDSVWNRGSQEVNKMNETKYCKNCKKYNKESDACTEAEFEGQYTWKCPKLKMKPPFSRKTLNTAKNVLRYGAIGLVVLLALDFGYAFVIMDRSEVGSVMEDVEVQQPVTVAVTPEPLATPTKTVVDPFKISAPVSSFEEWQAYTALVWANELHLQEGWETGVVLLSEKNSHGYATHTWSKSRGVTYVAVPLGDDDFLSMSKEDHARKYSTYLIKYVAPGIGQKWWSDMDDILSV